MIPNGMVKTKTLRSYFSHFHTRIFLVLCNRSYSYNCAIQLIVHVPIKFITLVYGGFGRQNKAASIRLC